MVSTPEAALASKFGPCFGNRKLGRKVGRRSNPQHGSFSCAGEANKPLRKHKVPIPLFKDNKGMSFISYLSRIICRFN